MKIPLLVAIRSLPLLSFFVALPAFAVVTVTGCVSILGIQICAGNGSNVQGVFATVLSIINGYIVPLIFAIAFIVFLWGLYTYFIAGGADEEKRKKGRDLVIWGLIGFVVMVSLWGIINILLNTFGLNATSRPCLPTTIPGYCI